MALKIQILTWDRHINVAGLNRLVLLVDEGVLGLNHS